MKKIYEKVIGLETNDAIKLLDKKGIDYETTSKLTFKEKTGYIVDVKENESGSLVLYESNRKMLIFIIILASLVVGLTATFGNGIYESIKEQIIEIGGIGKPELSVEEGWGQERTVNVIKDAKSNKKIIYYEYCVREKEEDKCNWNKTETKNVILGETGHWYVTFRAVNEEGKKGKEATVEAYVDNTVPEISSFRVIEKTTNSIKVKTDTKDLHSGIAKIMYSIDGRTYVEASEEYIYTNLQPGVTYRLYVKVYDKAENGTIVSILVKTELTEEQKQALTEEELKKLEEETEEEKEDKWDIPKINLDKLPSVFTEKEEYDLPSFYDFGNDEGEVVCLVDGEETKDTSFIVVGRHTVKCTATSNHGKIAEVEKEILVQAEVGEDEIEDGWLKLNLYYPEESYNWQWRYGLTDNDIDEEFEELGWEDYTGPILIKIEDIPRIYIRYDQDGETQILPPTGVAFVEITFAKEKVACGDSTEVTIEYDANAILKQYRLNGGPWQDYEGPLEVNGNTRVEARVTKNEDVYNTDGDIEYTKLITGRDIKTVKETGCINPEDAKLNLNGIPTTVYLGEDRSLPSYYTFGTHGEGTVECLDQNGNSLVTTKYLSVGTYTVTCSLEAGDGTTVGPISKTFTVKERVYAPEVSLWRIPSKIVKGDSYNLPSDYTYGSHGAGTVTCDDGLGNTITNTSGLEIGTYNISCLLTAGDGTQATTSTVVEVKEGFEPYIDLNGLRNEIYLGDFYYLPSHYGYGRPNVGTLTCEVDGVELRDTHTLELGSHEVECEIVNGAGQRATASKRFTVVPRPIEPETLAGPTITESPITLVEEAEITITPAESASIIKYSYDRSTWYTYTGPFTVNSNRTIYAYYVRQSDGKQSQTSHYYVKNIRKPNRPHVAIDANPDYLSSTVSSVEVTITGTDCDYIEYSFDNVIFTRYTGPFTVINSLTVYARGVDANGVGPTESLTITTSNPPAPKINLDVTIAANPDGTQPYLINETEVVVNYDSRAENKYYRIGSTGSWQTYTGPFKVSTNTTVYAYATCTNGSSKVKSLKIDFLTLGISDPVITLDKEPPLRAHSVKVHVEWDKNAIVKKYRIIDAQGTYGPWQDWPATGDLEIDENCTIEVMQEDSLGNKSNVVDKEINNIVPVPTYTPVEKDDYYLIKMNYPSTTDPENREYKWKDSGTWKEYDEKGILLIKQNAASKYDLTKDGVEIEDENGNKITIDIAHVYVLDVPVSEISGNLFMRWDNSKPTGPTINFNSEDAATEVEVTISYPKTLVDKYYRILYSDGRETEWLRYTGPFTIYQNNTTIYAKGSNRLEISSDVVNRVITNIDEFDPEIEITGDLETPTRQVNLTVNATDDKMLYMVKWAKGKKNIDYFSENGENKGTTIVNGSTVAIDSNGFYTFFAVDQAGNEIVEQVEVTNVDRTAPNVTITVLTQGVKTSAQVSIDFGDSKTKQYSIGGNSNYHNYEGTLTLSSYDYYELANPDGSLTLYAKGIDQAGNETEVFEYLRCLDLDKPQAPTINLHMDYPTLTVDGFTTNNYVEVTFANRDDITNEISLDNGTTWTTYTGRVAITDETTVKARSKKTASGFTTEVEEQVNPAEGALIEDAYDEDNSTAQELGALEKAIFYIVNDGSSKKISIRSTATSGSVVNVYGTNGGLTKTVDIGNGSLQIVLPSGTTKVEIVAGSSGLSLAEVKLNGVVASVEGTSILGIMQSNPNLTAGYYNFKVGDEIYSVHLIVENRNTITADTTYGDVFDVGTANSYAENMVIVKRDGDLTINENVTVAPYSTEYGGPKGFFLYVTGKLTNKGIINNSHGAYAVGQDVKIWQNADGSYEYIPATGGSGAAGATTTEGNPGGNGTGRQTGGGASGAVRGSYTSGTGGTGTAYSGGAGGGSITVTSYSTDTTTSNGSNVGGAGGIGQASNNSAGGGAGNPGGKGAYYGLGNKDECKGANGTGGLIIIYSNEFSNSGSIVADGAIGGKYADGSFTIPGGSSGGGSINIFTNQSTGIDGLGYNTNAVYSNILGTVHANGGEIAAYTTTYKGAQGGNGTVNIGQIRNGTYYDLKTVIEQDKIAYEESIMITGDSIISILQNNENLETGFYKFKVGNEKYSVHLIIEEKSVISESVQYGSRNDCAIGNSADQMAQNMVIVKRNGDLTINSGVTVGPFYTEYGGPKGFFLYVTGKLTNNGTIDNSHGAYAVNQDVILWKNGDNDYEIVPADGADGAAAYTAGWVSDIKYNSGSSGTDRRTAGGSSGYAAYSGTGAAGAKGTSYSGGAGGGGGVYNPNGNTTKNGTSALSNGGAGGNAGTVNSKNANNGGAGNPGVDGGVNGTGGLLIIYSNEYENNGTISAHGYDGGTPISNAYRGGSSGGGSINIFTNQSTGINALGINTNNRYNDLLGNVNASGGVNYKIGGSGSVSIGEIRNGIYYDLHDIIEQDKEAYEDSISITGDSILAIMQQNNLSTGYYTFKVGNEKYSVHLIEETDHTISNARTYGDTSDCASGVSSDKMAQNMVIVKVNGDLTITSTGSVGPTYNATYGGPKGFMLYVTGTLTNAGIIDNSHGAYAVGQDVYLWKNADGTYEKVPAYGSTGGSAYTSAWTGTISYNAGNPGSGRGTGGGSSGYAAYSGTGGAGAQGTSYSGGTGGGGGVYTPAGANMNNGGSGQSNGGEGGANSTHKNNSTVYSNGGAGNPGGSNGTGGLLIIYANEYKNNGTISAHGYDGGVDSNTLVYDGGSSGGGSINIFYNTKTADGTTQVSGGETRKVGGTGTVTYKQISPLTAGVNLTAHDLRVVENTLTANTVADTITPDIDAPEITVESKENSKLVTIKGEDVLRTEYSLDLGETWLEYTEAIEVEENIVIMARTIDGDGKVLKASTYTITTIEKKEETQEEPQEESTEVLPPEVTPEIVEENVSKEEKPEEGDTNE